MLQTNHTLPLEVVSVVNLTPILPYSFLQVFKSLRVEFFFYTTLFLLFKRANNTNIIV